MFVFDRSLICGNVRENLRGSPQLGHPASQSAQTLSTRALIVAASGVGDFNSTDSITLSHLYAGQNLALLERVAPDFDMRSSVPLAI